MHCLPKHSDVDKKNAKVIGLVFTSLFSTKENFQKKSLNSMSTTNNQIAGSHKIYSQCLITSLLRFLSSGSVYGKSLMF